MKLSYRYTLAYALLTFLVLTVGFTIVYVAVQRNARQSMTARLEHLNGLTVRLLRAGKDYRTHPSRQYVTVSGIRSGGDTAARTRVRKEWNPGLQAVVPMLRVDWDRNIRGRWYRISSEAVLLEPDDIYLNGIILVFAWTFIFLLALVVVLSEVFSYYILRPFNATLDAMQRFRLNEEDTVAVQPTDTAEFRQLNDFLLHMTAKARTDYTVLREFTENASHELQTPIATMTAKIELLLQTDLQEQQAGMLSSLHDELQRLARVNQALILLAKLEQYERDDTAVSDFSAAVLNGLQRFSDWLEMKDIRLEKSVEPGVVLAGDEALTQILVTNLVSNAIRHNGVGGQLKVRLSRSSLTIANTGEAPSIPVEDVFRRFRRGNSAIDSIGIGLAIVQKIVAVHQHSISYRYEGGWHEVVVVFGGPES